LFGQQRDALYPDHFFCSSCKKYEDCITFGTLHQNSRQSSTQFRCTAKRYDYFMPPHFKKVQSISYITHHSSLKSSRLTNSFVYGEKIDSDDDME